jgi:hypothetical protein
MITNDRFYEVLGSIPSEERQIIRRRRNPKWVKKGERDLMFLELPHSPLRIVERAAEIARYHFMWEGVEWGIDNEGCWVKPRWMKEGKNYFEIIEKEHPRHEAEMHAALRLLASVSRDRNS